MTQPLSALVDEIEKRRKSKNWSREELCEYAGVNINTYKDIARLRTQNPGIFTIEKLATALNCTVGDLKGETEGSPLPRPVTSIDVDVLADLTDGIRKAVKSLDLPLSSREEAEILAYLYDEAIENQGEFSTENINNLVKFTSKQR